MRATGGNGSGRVARAEKKLGKAVSKLPSSRDDYSTFLEKKENLVKNKAKVAKAQARLGKVVNRVNRNK
jgi:hypothetical protein